MKPPRNLAATWALAGLALASPAPSHAAAPASLDELARQNLQVHRFSTLFTAQDVRQRLSTDSGLETAVDWCRRTAVTKVYVE